MRAVWLAVAAVVTIAAAPPKKLTPTDVVAASKPGEWRAIAAEDLLVIDLKSGKRIILQLAPRFAPVHVANIRALARSGHWQGASIYRVQDNYVAQWGNADSEKPWPKGVDPTPPKEYSRSLKGLRVKPLGFADSYAPAAGFVDGWPIAYSPRRGWASLAHCYAMVGAGRGLEDSGSGGELYAIIGHSPRHMDRNLAVVGRVVEGIEHLSALPRGTEALGFYKNQADYVPIASVRMASDLPAAERPKFEVMDTNSRSFARYVRVRGHRDDDFYRVPALGTDLCNVQVPIRRKA